MSMHHQYQHLSSPIGICCWFPRPRFKSARPPIEQLLNMIPVLKPRSSWTLVTWAMQFFFRDSFDEPPQENEEPEGFQPHRFAFNAPSFGWQWSRGTFFRRARDPFFGQYHPSLFSFPLFGSFIPDNKSWGDPLYRIILPQKSGKFGESSQQIPRKTWGYSIASSPLMHPDKIQLCVVLVDWTVESTQELRLGEATGAGPSWRMKKKVCCFVRHFWPLNMRIWPRYMRILWIWYGLVMDLMRKHVNLIWKRRDFIYNLRWTKLASGKNEQLWCGTILIWRDNVFQTWPRPLRLHETTEARHHHDVCGATERDRVTQGEVEMAAGGGSKRR